MALNFRSKQWLAGIVLLLCGFILGVLTAPFFMKNVFHLPDFPPPHPHEIAEKIMERLTDDLNLTDTQAEQIRPSIVRSAKEVNKLRQSIEPEIRAILDKEMALIDQYLTPEQQKLHQDHIKDFRKRHEEMKNKHEKSQ